MRQDGRDLLVETRQFGEPCRTDDDGQHVIEEPAALRPVGIEPEQDASLSRILGRKTGR